MTALEKLQYECENCHRDILLALADEAEEAGNLPLARGYRWLSKNGKWPLEIRSGEFNSIHYYWMQSPRPYYPYHLPGDAWNDKICYAPHLPLQDRTPPNRKYQSVYEALKAAAEGVGPTLEEVGRGDALQTSRKNG